MRSLASLSLSPSCPFCKKFEDSIEHFAYCPIIRARYRGNHCAFSCIDQFFALDDLSYPEDTPKLACLLSSVFLARNALIHNPSTHFTPQGLLVAMYSYVYR